MKVKQICLIEQKPEQKQREIIAWGLELIARNVVSLVSEAKSAHECAPRLAEIALNVAMEEAGKGFLLVDYVRPYQGVGNKQRAKHLKGFYNHLARGLYARYYETNPATYAEVIEEVNAKRRLHYIDPDSGSYVLRNEILQEREDALYVDFVVDFILDDDELRWSSPVKPADDFFRPLRGWFSTPRVCELFQHMYQLGLFTPVALEILANVWRCQNLTPDTQWGTCSQLNQEFLEECRRGGVLTSTEGLQTVIDKFLFPLCGLNLAPIKVKEAKLSSPQSIEKRNRHDRTCRGDPPWSPATKAWLRPSREATEGLPYRMN